MDLVINKKRVRVISVYGEQGGKNLEEKMERCIREGKENLIVEGDLNIRLEELRGMEIEGEGMERCSKDKTIRNKDKSFTEWVRDKDL